MLPTKELSVTCVLEFEMYNSIQLREVFLASVNADQITV